MDLIIIFFSVLAVASALLVVVMKNPVNSALFLVLMMISMAFIFLFLNVEFIAVIQILVYAGAIMVLFLFIIMLLAPEKEYTTISKHRILFASVFLISVAVTSLLLYGVLSTTYILDEPLIDTYAVGSVEKIAERLFTEYIVAFVFVAILLTMAAVGALILTKKGDTQKQKFINHKS